MWKGSAVSCNIYRAGSLLLYAVHAGENQPIPWSQVPALHFALESCSW